MLEEIGRLIPVNPPRETWLILRPKLWKKETAEEFSPESRQRSAENGANGKGCVYLDDFRVAAISAAAPASRLL